MKDKKIDLKYFPGKFLFSITNIFKSRLKWETNDLTNIVMKIKIQYIFLLQYDDKVFVGCISTFAKKKKINNVVFNYFFNKH